jgi:hypothetical protein
MAEELQPQGDAQAAAQSMQIFVDEHEMRTLYANMVRIHTTQEEVVLDLVFNMPNPNPRGGPQQPQMLFKVSDRVIVSYATAKRLAQQITQLIKRYEQQFGEVPMAPGQRAMPPR